MKRSLKPEAIFRFVTLKVSATVGIMLLFGITQANPPFFTRRIDRFSSCASEFNPRILCDFIVRRKCDQNRTSSPQSIFVNIQFVTRQSLINSLLQRLAGQCAGGGAIGSQQCRSE